MEYQRFFSLFDTFSHLRYSKSEFSVELLYRKDSNMFRPLNKVSSYMQRLIKCSSSRVQIKDSGLTLGVDEETSPFFAVKVSFRVHSKR